MKKLILALSMFVVQNLVAGEPEKCETRGLTTKNYFCEYKVENLPNLSANGNNAGHITWGESGSHSTFVTDKQLAMILTALSLDISIYLSNDIFAGLEVSLVPFPEFPNW